MIFQLPKKKIADFVWFITEDERIVYGQIDMVTIVIKARIPTFEDPSNQEVALYYGIIDTAKESHTVNEIHIIDQMQMIPTPKYPMNSRIKFVYIDSKESKKSYATTGTITGTEIRTYANSDPEVIYYVNDDTSYWIHEDEVINFAESVIDVSALPEKTSS